MPARSSVSEGHIFNNIEVVVLNVRGSLFVSKFSNINY